MAGDWLKVEVCTPDKPEIWQIAQDLNIDPDAAFGKLFRLWSWFDTHTEDGNAPSVSKLLIDRAVGVTGFCESVIHAGWMSEGDGILILPHFDRHNGKTAKNRALTAKRVAKHKANEKVTQRALPREEKEKNKKTSKKSEPSVPHCPHSEIIDLYHEFLPELQTVTKSRWKGSKREKNLLARWREDERHQNIEFWKRFFCAVRSNPHWLGKNGWSANLGWLIERKRFDDVLDIIVDQQRRAAS